AAARPRLCRRAAVCRVCPRACGVRRQPPRGGWPLMGAHILAVDDSRTIRDLLHLTLAEAGHRVSLAEDGQQALDLLSTIEPDAILTDINMPRLDGFGLIEAVRAIDRLRMVPILVLTTEVAP